jgi:hypothetical protein
MGCHHLMMQRGRIASIQVVSSMAQMLMIVTESASPSCGQIRFGRRTLCSRTHDRSPREQDLSLLFEHSWQAGCALQDSLRCSALPAFPAGFGRARAVMAVPD